MVAARVITLSLAEVLLDKFGDCDVDNFNVMLSTILSNYNHFGQGKSDITVNDNKCDVNKWLSFVNCQM